LTLGNGRIGIARPHLLLRAEHAKLNRPRRVPFWWDAGTLADLSAWLDYRFEQGARRDDPFICSLQKAVEPAEAELANKERPPTWTAS